MPRDELIISTKAGYRMWPGPYGEGSSREHLLASLEQSLQRLGLHYVDIYYSHRYDPETPLEERLAALEDVVRQGKALYVGVNNYAAEQFAAISKLATQKGAHPLGLHQLRYNLLERGGETAQLKRCARGGHRRDRLLTARAGLLTTNITARSRKIRARPNPGAKSSATRT